MEILQPKLRFPEFRDNWYKLKVEGNFEVCMCKRIFANQTTTEGDVPFYKIGTLGNKADAFISRELYNEYKSKYKFPIKSDVLLTCSGTVGKTVIYDGNDSYFQDSNIVWLKNNEKKITNNFLYRLLNNINWSKLNSTTITRIYSSDLKNLSFSFPSFQEQTKIAEVLGSVDKQLELLNTKKEKLSLYKKGVMQQLFSQQLRFKDENENDYSEWEEKTLGEIGVIVSGLTYSPKDVVDDGLLVLRSSNIQNNKLSFNDNVFVNVKKYNPVKADDILICVRNGSKYLIGKNALITDNENGFAFGAFMTIYRSNFNKYIFHWMQHSTYKEYVNKNLGATINSINSNDLKKFLIPFPSSEEQTKIANFLSAIDKQIETVEIEITKTEVYKKGLLQQMFV